MGFKFFDEIYSELEKREFQPLPANHTSGEEFEEWLRQEKNDSYSFYWSSLKNDEIFVDSFNIHQDLKYSFFCNEKNFGKNIDINIYKEFNKTIDVESISIQLNIEMVGESFNFKEVIGNTYKVDLGKVA
jgi:hypothetical protein